MTATELRNHPTIIRLAALQKELDLRDLEFSRTLRFRIHGANWGKILAGTYTGSFQKALVNLEICLDEYENQNFGEVEEGIVVLQHVRETLDAVAIARSNEDEHRLVILSGPRGAGKSRTLQLVHTKYPGYLVFARPSWAKSYNNFLNKLANGLGLDTSSSAGEAETKLIDFMQITPRKTLCIGEFNYFSPDALGFIKTVLNETNWTVVADTIPVHLARMASSRATMQEAAQLLRRAVAIIKIQPITPRTVECLRKALFPKLELNGSITELVQTANRCDRIDSVCQILGDCDPDNPADVPKAIERHKRLHNAQLKPGED
ncbi:MAG: ATP-binding protein [Luteolibacter sp.]